MSEILLVASVLSTATVINIALYLRFLLVVYLRGGRDDLLAAAKALHWIRSVGVGPSIRGAIKACKSTDNKA